MKILHISNYYPPHVGGIEDVCYSIISNLDEIQHKVICFSDEKFTEKDLYSNIEVVRCGVVKKIFSQSISFSFYSELKQIIKTFAPDIIHFHAPNPLASVYLMWIIPRKIKLVIHWHGDITEQKILSKFYSPIENRLLKRSDKILITSPTYLGGSKALFPFEDKIRIIANTVNVTKLEKKDGDDAEIEKIKNRYENSKIVFAFGRHVAYKGFDYLIEAASFVSDDAVILIAGKGPISEQLKKRAKATTNVRFIGRISDDELRRYLYASDIFAFPSITRNEAFGIALAEAMYCGLPAVTFTILHSGVNWVSLDGITGLEAENRNVAAFADAINKLVADSSLRNELGTNATLRVKTYFMNQVIKDQLEPIYNDLIS